jgi:predicted RNase H-like HicB family nuclease
MAIRYVLTEYVERAMSLAVFEMLEDHTYGGRIPLCPGVVAFGSTLRSCKAELRSTLEDWLLLGLKLGHTLPVLGEIDLNQEPVHEPVDAL